MRLIEVDMKQEYQRSFGKRQDEEVLEFIFSHGLFPRRLYYPVGASMIGDPLFTLPDEVQEVSYFQKRGNFSLRKMFELFFGSDVIVKNQDEILEEKGELIITEYGSYGDVKVERILSNLYPGEKYAHLAFDAVKMRGKTYQILVQVGFVRKNRLRLEDTLPSMHNIMLTEERSIIYPVLEDLLKKMVSQIQYVCLN